MSEEIRKRLFSLQDIGYRDFSAALMPTVPKDRVIGVRTPVLRKLAKEWNNTALAEAFLRELPHTYYEENNLHVFLIGQIKDFSACLAEVERFLPYVDNWATCDSMRPAVFKKMPKKLCPAVRCWLASDRVYTVRFALGMRMAYFLEGEFDPVYLEEAATLRSEEYYVNMMIAWYFATALAKQWAAAIPYLEKRRLSPWVHAKTIQKAVESFRITPEQKAYLKSLRA